MVAVVPVGRRFAISDDARKITWVIFVEPSIKCMMYSLPSRSLPLLGPMGFVAFIALRLRILPESKSGPHENSTSLSVSRDTQCPDAPIGDSRRPLYRLRCASPDSPYCVARLVSGPLMPRPHSPPQPHRSPRIASNSLPPDYCACNDPEAHVDVKGLRLLHYAEGCDNAGDVMQEVPPPLVAQLGFSFFNPRRPFVRDEVIQSLLVIIVMAS